MDKLDGGGVHGTGATGGSGMPAPDARPEATARTRLEALGARIDRLIPDDLAHVGLPEGRGEARDTARRAADAAVERAGLAALADDARDLARDRLLERWSAGAYRPTWAGALNWGISTGRADDRAAVILAVEDAALAAIAEDVLDDETLAVLAGDGEAILAMATGGPAEESLAAAVHAAAASRNPLVAAGLVAFLLLLVAPAAAFLALGGGSPGAFALGVGALVLAGSIAVIVIRRARRGGADVA